MRADIIPKKIWMEIIDQKEKMKLLLRIKIAIANMKKTIAIVIKMKKTFLSLVFIILFF
jgi:hypothetical protein